MVPANVPRLSISARHSLGFRDQVFNNNAQAAWNIPIIQDRESRGEEAKKSDKQSKCSCTCLVPKPVDRGAGKLVARSSLDFSCNTIQLSHVCYAPIFSLFPCHLLIIQPSFWIGKMKLSALSILLRGVSFALNLTPFLAFEDWEILYKSEWIHPMISTGIITINFRTKSIARGRNLTP